jgi:hypothetical protein
MSARDAVEQLARQPYPDRLATVAAQGRQAPRIRSLP